MTSYLLKSLNEFQKFLSESIIYFPTFKTAEKLLRVYILLVVNLTF